MIITTSVLFRPWTWLKKATTIITEKKIMLALSQPVGGWVCPLWRLRSCGKNFDRNIGSVADCLGVRGILTFFIKIDGANMGCGVILRFHDDKHSRNEPCWSIIPLILFVLLNETRPSFRRFVLTAFFFFCHKQDGRNFGWSAIFVDGNEIQIGGCYVL